MPDTHRPKRGAANIAVSQNALSTTAEVIAASRPTRVRVIVRNQDASISVYVGHSDAVTSSNGFLLKAEESVSFYTTAALYAIAASGTPSVSVTEEYE